MQQFDNRTMPRDYPYAHPSIALILEKLTLQRGKAQQLYRQNEHKSVLTCSEALREAEQALPPGNYVELIDTREELAELHLHFNQPHLAKNIAIEAFNQHYDPTLQQAHDRKLLGIMRLLVRCFIATGRLDDAEYIASLGQPYLITSDVRPDDAKSLKILGNKFLEQQRFFDAHSVFKDALLYETSVFGPGHAETVDSRWGCAKSFYGCQQYADARQFAQENEIILGNSQQSFDKDLGTLKNFIKECAQKLQGLESLPSPPNPTLVMHFHTPTISSQNIDASTPIDNEQSPQRITQNVVSSAKTRSWVTAAKDTQGRKQFDLKKKAPPSNQTQQDTSTGGEQVDGDGSQRSFNDSTARGRRRKRGAALSASITQRSVSSTTDSRQSYQIAQSNVSRESGVELRAKPPITRERSRVEPVPSVAGSQKSARNRVQKVQQAPEDSYPRKPDALHPLRISTAIAARRASPQSPGRNSGGVFETHYSSPAIMSGISGRNSTDIFSFLLGESGEIDSESHLSGNEIASLKSKIAFIAGEQRAREWRSDVTASQASGFSSVGRLSPSPQSNFVEPQLAPKFSTSSKKESEISKGVANSLASPNALLSGSWYDSKLYPDIRDDLAKDADKWMYDLDGWALPEVHSLIKQCPVDVDKSKVKICLIDTGLDGSHPFLKDAPWKEQDAGFRIKGCLWFDDKGKLQVGGAWPGRYPETLAYVDEDGHGTHCAGSVLRTACNANIYIAKVVTGKGQNPNAKFVAEAIKYAGSSDKWGVDIISMSLGFPDWEDEVANAIDNVQKGTLIFAAASNPAGKRSKLAFPSSMRTVTCVKSASGNGTPSESNPTDKHETGPNLTALGEGVLSMWPVQDLRGERILQRRMSGTSVATPIAASCAALILEFVSQEGGSVKEFSKCLARLKSDRQNGIERLLKEMSDFNKPLKTHFLTPWKMLRTEYDQSDKDARKVVIKEIWRCLKQ